MPFIGRDWRSPGEAWVKTESLGWQRMKIIESQLYLTCHQNHANACSWPPRSQFGQHMEEHCNRRAACDRANLAETDNSSGTSAVDSPAGSSQSNSASTSPTRTPENNNARHIHPIAISSPYGRFSSPCCARNNHDSSNDVGRPSSPCTSPRSTGNCTPANEMLGTGHAQTISRSLSREIMDPTNCHCLSPSSGPRLHAKNSVPDFRPSANFYDQQMRSNTVNCRQSDNPSESIKSEASQPKMVVASRQASCVPILMRNGTPIDSQELTSSKTNNIQAVQESKKTVSYEPAASRSPSPSAPKLETDHEFAQQRPCACCCCCSSASGALNSHHHLMMEIQQPKTAPHCQISVRTREVAMHNTISEAFYRLDFYNAIHDIRRFNYICKLLHLLITQNLTSLSGCATRVLFTMLEQVAWEVSSNKRNIHVIKNLLNELKQTIQKYYCWGRPIGSSLLWQQHFETIERISQIVNGIELSPPKNDGFNVTFDKLPVEMVREILLRLDDYRDLVNSAKASPVMQTMIDSQSIWQKLCRYHFTEQQLKVALNSGNSLILVKKASRGVKYARTTTADGRGSYRNPVAHKSASLSATAKVGTTRRQLEQASNRRCATADRRGSTNSSGEPRPSMSTSSYVTNAVRIFDDKQRGIVRTNCDRKVGSTENTGRNVIRSRRFSLGTENEQRLATTDGSVSAAGQSQELDSSNLEIDWERVFHQLRKRFDLKEEYADCLLLCRHCRCLFWKSFGHPCIKGDGMRQQPQTSGRQPESKPDESSGSSSSAAGATSRGLVGGRTNGQKHIAGCSRRDSFRSLGNSGGCSSSGAGRQSVASLSRNFDRATRDEENNGLEPNRLAASDYIPRGSAAPRQGSGEPAAMDGTRQRQPLNNLDVQLREHNANRQRRQPHLAPTGRENATTSAQREELVPKHVTVTPQAFLKFFSL